MDLRRSTVGGTDRGPKVQAGPKIASTLGEDPNIR
jgi:hypothetical protein